MAMTPTRISVSMYRVGFGDCFLLTVDYGPGAGRRQRHVLIDCGSKESKDETLIRVAESIRDRIDELDVIVVSHRHQDHLRAFGIATAAPIFDALAPKAVLRPWTENPLAPADAQKPAHTFALGSQLAERIDQSSFALADTLAGQALRNVAALQIANQDAITKLDAWSANDAGRYLQYGDDPKLSAILPGVTITVLGPPSPKEWPEISRQRQEDEDQFWLALADSVPAALASYAAKTEGPVLGMGGAVVKGDEAANASQAIDAGAAGAAAAAAEATALAEAVDNAGAAVDDAGAADTDAAGADAPEGHASDSPAPGPIGPVRWLTEKLRDQQAASYLRIVTWLDDAMNNTSLILLVTVGDRRLLFPGDAQIENWEWALDKAPDHEAVRQVLRDVDLYKVGHHASRNATPKQSLYPLWENRARPLTVLLSTRSGVYKKKEKVPNEDLVTALQQPPLRLVRTANLPPLTSRAEFQEVSAAAHGAADFELVAQP